MGEQPQVAVAQTLVKDGDEVEWGAENEVANHAPKVDLDEANAGTDEHWSVTRRDRTNPGRAERPAR